MKKKISVFIVMLSCLALFPLVNHDHIRRYAGSNADELIDLLHSAHPDTLEFVQFILQNASPSDLAILTSDYITQNIRLALKARELPYAGTYDDDIFKHFVLPHRMSQEPLEEWRPVYYQELLPVVKDARTISEAAILVNLWCLEEMTYKPTHGRDQSAFTSSKRGYGRCEEMMIIYMCAARAVGIPVRSCSAPYWNFTDSNHAWIEVWTPSGWKYLGEPASSLSKTWFTNTTQRATLITAKAFGNYDHHNVIKQQDNVTTLSSIEYYTDSYRCRINVKDINGNPVSAATVTPMAVSFGGLWGLTNLTTDNYGECELPLGKGSTLIIAGKDSLSAWQMLSNLDGSDRSITLTLNDDNTINEDFDFLFPLPGSNPRSNEEPVYFADKFDLMRENAGLRHKERLNSQKQTAEFARFFDIVKNCSNPDEDYFAERKSFLELTDELAANADDFLHVLENQNDDGKWVVISMLETWDIKDLCEIPDSTALQELVAIYALSRYQFGIGDSLFSNHCIARTWRSSSPVQNRWQKEFHDLIKPQLDNNISSSVISLNNWIAENTLVEEDFTYTYYSAPLNPLQILNMYHIPDFYRTKLLNSALKLAGIPVRWEGQLQYYDGSDWLPARQDITAEQDDSLLRSFSLSLFVDSLMVKAEPYDNFLVAALAPDGSLYPTWFDGENDSLTFTGKYRLEIGETIHLEAAIRNGNGDAAVAVRSLTADNQNITIHLQTPKEYLDSSDRWQDSTLERIRQITALTKGTKSQKILIVRSRTNSEPQIHTTRFLAEKMDKFSELGAQLFFYSEDRPVNDLKDDFRLQSAVLKQGKPFLNKELSPEEYPAIFVLDEDDNLIFSTYGYNMGIADLIIKKLK